MSTMDGYKARKTPNVSHFLANLNTLPSAHEAATQQQEDFNIDDELAQFTNTEFLDFDAGELPMPEYNTSLEENARREVAAANNKISGKGMDLVTGMFYSTWARLSKRINIKSSRPQQKHVHAICQHR